MFVILFLFCAFFPIVNLIVLKHIYLYQVYAFRYCKCPHCLPSVFAGDFSWFNEILYLFINLNNFKTTIFISRFRLVALTNMDRSPSESSLEKIERTDVIEITNHNAIVMQTKENAEVEKEEAVKQAVAKCESEWAQKLDTELSVLKAKCETEKQVSPKLRVFLSSDQVSVFSFVTV